MPKCAEGMDYFTYMKGEKWQHEQGEMEVHLGMLQVESFHFENGVFPLLQLPSPPEGILFGRRLLTIQVGSGYKLAMTPTQAACTIKRHPQNHHTFASSLIPKRMGPLNDPLQTCGLCRNVWSCPAWPNVGRWHSPHSYNPRPGTVSVFPRWDVSLVARCLLVSTNGFISILLVVDVCSVLF